MTESLRALVVAPSPRVSIVTRAGLEGYDVAVVSPDELHRDGSPLGVSQLLDGRSAAEASLLVIGDEVFPAMGSADASLRQGLRTSFLATKIAVRGMMRRRHGRVVAIAPARQGCRPPHQAAVYGLSGLIRSVAREVGSRGISANVIALGSESGEMPSESLIEGREASDGLLTALRFLLDDGNRGFTGQVLSVGQTVGSP